MMVSMENKAIIEQLEVITKLVQSGLAQGKGRGSRGTWSSELRHALNRLEMLRQILAFEKATPR
jgi:hypothetical protein